MFNMSEIGKNIATLRKQKNMTQMELADALGISYQAVSNWERGTTMPDIAKLPELSELFGCTVDELLLKESKLVDCFVNDKPIEITVSVQELKEAAPILKPQQITKAYEKIDMKKEGIEAVLSLAPFLDRETVDDLFDKCVAGASEGAVCQLLPFVSANQIEKAYQEFNKNGKSIAAFLPFLSQATINSGVEQAFEKGGANEIVLFLPFLSKEKINELAQKCPSKDLILLAPFLDNGVMGEVIRKYLEK